MPDPAFSTGLQQQEQLHGHLHRARANLHNGLAKLSSADRRTIPPRAPSRSSLRPSGQRHLRTLSLSRAATDRTFELVNGPWHALGSHIGLRAFARVPEPGMEAGLGRPPARALLSGEMREREASAQLRWGRAWRVLSELVSMYLRAVN